jgi:MFS transporter, ACDE family, multidrug resistance protein
LLTFIVLLGPQIFYLPILMHTRFDAPSYVIGAVLSGASLTTTLTSTQLSRLTERFSEKSLLRAAFVLYAIALTVVAFCAKPAAAHCSGHPDRYGVGDQPP